SLAAVGGAALAIGAGFGVDAIVKQSASNARCPTRACRDPAGLRDNADARTAAVVADIAIPAGLAAAGVGVALLALPGRARRAARRFHLDVTVSRGASASLTTAF
ncbi:MAG TPA: hypothetical protein VHB21_05355, partial [Minicystis sp.]|nr:hypothetical protein [Minicystis sp.]